MKTIEQMVKQEVSCCLSSLVATLASGDAQPGSDLAELCDRALGLAEPVPDYEEAATQAGHYGKADDGQFYWALEGQYIKADAKFVTAEGFCVAHDIDPIDSAVFEHWAVSPSLAERLLAHGEKVDTAFAGLNVWARQSRDLPISADDVIVRIYARMMA